jgi:hypothetical protein
MYLDVKVRLSNEFWARHPVDTVAMWLKRNSTSPFRVDNTEVITPPGRVTKEHRRLQDKSDESLFVALARGVKQLEPARVFNRVALLR